MGKIFSVASGKGGTGKSVVTARLAKSMARYKPESKILAVDLDVGMRSLDMLLNMQDKIVFDMGDIALSRCTQSDALYSHEKLKNLFLLCSPNVTAEFDIFQAVEIIKNLKNDFDFIFIDLPAGLGLPSIAAKSLADLTIIVTIPDNIALRSAKSLADFIGDAQKRLIINRISGSMMKQNGIESLDDVTEMIKIPLLGALLEDPLINAPVKERRKSKISAADTEEFNSMAQRLCGAYKPLAVTKLIKK